MHRREDEIAFLRQRLLDLEKAIHQQKTPPPGRDGRDWLDVYQYEWELADELLHARHTEPLGETLQRRLAMAERLSRELTPKPEQRDKPSQVYWIAEKARLALDEMLQKWWAWLAEPFED
jgi:hypothetical protein